MASVITGYELRVRPFDSGQVWNVTRHPPDTTTITLKGLSRGVTYEGDARSIGQGSASAWVPVAFVVAPALREGPTALPPVTIGNVSSRWVAGTAVAFTATDTAATITVTAGTLQVGDTQLSYAASSAALVGTASEVRTVYLYYDDPQFEGGTRTLGVTTDKVSSMAEYGRIYIASLIVTFDAAGGGGTGGGGDIGGGGGGSGGTAPINTV